MSRACCIAAFILALLPGSLAAALIEPSVGGQAALRAFNQFDVDSDGTLDAAEFERAKTQPDLLLAIIDRNGDGLLQPGEFIRSNLRATLFRRLDRDRSGSLEPAEFRRGAMTELFGPIDGNGDGRISAAELRPGLPAGESRPLASSRPSESGAPGTPQGCPSPTTFSAGGSMFLPFTDCR